MRAGPAARTASAGWNRNASLADETLSPACDAVPEPLDVALAIERINEATALDLRHVRRAWAGLRSFVADRLRREPRQFWIERLAAAGVPCGSVRNLQELFDDPQLQDPLR